MKTVDSFITESIIQYIGIVESCGFTYFRSRSLHFRANSSHLSVRSKCLHVRTSRAGEQKGVYCITIIEASECPKTDVVSTEIIHGTPYFPSHHLH
jgi:hypothetical protein